MNSEILDSSISKRLHFRAGLCGIPVPVPEIPDSGAFSRNFVPDRIPDFSLRNPEF